MHKITFHSHLETEKKLLIYNSEPYPSASFHVIPFQGIYTMSTLHKVLKKNALVSISQIDDFELHGVFSKIKKIFQSQGSLVASDWHIINKPIKKFGFIKTGLLNSYAEIVLPLNETKTTASNEIKYQKFVDYLRDIYQEECASNQIKFIIDIKTDSLPEDGVSHENYYFLRIVCTKPITHA